MNQSLMLNIIPFESPVQNLTIPLYIGRRDGFYSYFLDDELKELVGAQMSKLEKLENYCLYTDFKEPAEEAILVTINIDQKPHLALRYFKHLVYSYFRNGVADIMQKNFIKDIELWFINPNEKGSNYSIYDKFTLRLSYGNVTSGFELIVSYGGTSKVSKKSLKELPGFDTSKLHLLNNNGIISKYENIDPKDKLHLDKIFPIIGRSLYEAYNIAPELPDRKNRYPRFYRPIIDFYNNYLDNDYFRAIIPLRPEGFIKDYTATVSRLADSSNLLQYGLGTGTEPKTDLKSLGPCEPVPPPNNVTFFFIYQQNCQDHYKQIKTYFEEGFRSHPNLQDFIHQPFFIDEKLNIVFKDLGSIMQTVFDTLKIRKKNPDTKYFIIYISPISRLTESLPEKKLYYRLKEMFLHYEYYSQVIYKNNIISNGEINNNFNFYLPNIQAAILAKLGGIPWRLVRVENDELIIGIGAFNSSNNKNKFLGSAFCFNNTGKFNKFTCFEADDTLALAGSIREAVQIFFKDHPNTSRIIIHFYKVISKKELKPILDILYRGLGLEIPVIVVTINKSVSKDILAFDTSIPSKLMPYSGTYIKITKRQYLLFNNTRYTPESKVTEREYHFPIKIKLTSTKLEMLEDEKLIETLIDQVYQFSRMYWKSVSQQNTPVTIAYPEMVAKMFAYFKYDYIPPFGQNNLWFL